VSTLRSPVVVTGAAGNLGSRLVPWLESQGREVRPVDIVEIDHPLSVVDDLRQPRDDRAWMSGVQAVVHLAGLADSTASWEAVEAANVTSTYEIVNAAKWYGIERLVLASSVWAMRARWLTGAVVEAGPAAPGDHPYGRSKAAAEAAAARGVLAGGLSTVVLRIGGRAPGDGRPHQLDDWEDTCWLGWQDFLRGVDCALDAVVEGVAVVNLVSDNPVPRWSLDEARDLIGYVPQERYEPAPKLGRLTSLKWRLAQRLRRA